MIYNVYYGQKMETKIFTFDFNFVVVKYVVNLLLVKFFKSIGNEFYFFFQYVRY